MYLTDFPYRVPLQDYSSAIEAMVEKLKHYPGVESIYQIGGMGNPGISDIDLFVVFSDDARCLFNPLDDLSPPHRYLFVHNVFGATSTDFIKSQQYDFFHDYKLVYGREFQIGQLKLPEEKLRTVNAQAAIEYLIKLYANMTVERTYGIIRVRGMLLLAKAVKYDLDALMINPDSLSAMVRRVLHWRNHWFEEKVDPASLLMFHEHFYDEIRKIIISGIAKHGFFIPAWADLRIADNMTLVQAHRVGFRRRGVCLPSAFGWMGRKYFNLQHRMNRFVFEAPFKTDQIPGPILDRHSFITEICAHNSMNLPYFAPAPYGLPLFRRK